MKSKLFAVLLGVALFSSPSVRGEESYASVDRPGLKIGVQAGATFNDVSSPSDINSNNRTGLAAGVRVALPITSFIAIQPEANLMQRGVGLSSGAFSVSAKYTTLQVPVLLKVSLPSKVTPYLAAGPVAFLNVSRSVEVGTPGGNAGANFQPRTFEFGASLGGGVEFGPVFVAANYLFGVTQLDENTADYHSRGFQLMGGVQF